jgi:hypothetical protein
LVNKCRFNYQKDPIPPANLKPSTLNLFFDEIECLSTTRRDKNWIERH